MLPSAQLIIIELGCLDICNRNMRKFVVKYNQMECSCKSTSCFGIKMYYYGLLAFVRFYRPISDLSMRAFGPSNSAYAFWPTTVTEHWKRDHVGQKFKTELLVPIIAHTLG